MRNSWQHEDMDAGKDTIVRLAVRQDVERVAEIYLAAFPRHTRSLMGIRTCSAFLSAVMRHPAYGLLVASSGADVLGFAVVHLDQKECLGKRWMLSSKRELLTFGLHHPEFLVRRLSAVVSRKIDGVPMRWSSSQGTSRMRKIAYLDVIAVDSLSRGNGVARRLIEECIRLGRKRGLDELKLTVEAENAPAIRLYEAMAFRRGAYSEQTDSYVYRLRLVKDRGDHATEPSSAVE